ncbi:MAG TPA: hypothetical protein VFW53_00285, partial [Gallionella sp.]|nr:hypothetical protein [Gallionella sp.]
RLLAGSDFPMRRLAWPLAISVLLHAAVLSQLNWNKLPAPTSKRHALTVSLEPAPSIRQEKISQDSNPHPARTNIAEQGESNPKKISHPTKGIETSTAKNTNGAAAPLDMNRLLNQASDYAKKELRTSEPAFALDGDYYGTYDGSDSGTFFVHLDNAGHASGTGQSSTFGISFSIAGDATKDGFIQMSGTGIAGIARFRGRLDIKTGKVSGSWFADRIGSGTFSGHHE